MEEENSAKAKHQQHSTRRTLKKYSTMEKSKGKVEEEKCECKVYVEVFL